VTAEAELRESPFRLAEDLSVADVRSRGRLRAGFSAGVPPTADLPAGLVYDGDWREDDLSHARIARLAGYLRGGFLGGPDTVVPHPAGPQRPRLRPHDPGLAGRLWYGAGSLRSADPLRYRHPARPAARVVAVSPGRCPCLTGRA
jgi:alkanesulfonate monooxygenase SsuD/methylene tetrahydromethanopterin reductase-like flavin-dependent oxidoreductase (luciferase family)